MLRSIDLRGLQADLHDRHPRPHHDASMSACARASRWISASSAGSRRSSRRCTREKGYRFAKVAVHGRGRPATTSGGWCFTVDEGDRVRDRRHRLRGQHGLRRPPPAPGDEEDQGDRPDHPVAQEGHLQPGHARGGPGQGRATSTAAPATRTCVVGEPQVEVRARNPEAAEPQAPEAPPVPRPSRSTEGERWKFGEITIEGNERLHRRGAAARVRAASPAAGCAPRRSTRASRRSSDVYHNTGYIFARSTPELVERDGRRRRRGGARSARATSSRSAGSSSRATTAPATRCCAASCASRRGLFLNMGGAQEQRAQGQPARLLQAQRGRPGRVRELRHREKELDLAVKGEEADRTELQFGGGWSELDGFFGQFSVRTQNFLGRGETVGRRSRPASCATSSTCRTSCPGSSTGRRSSASRPTSSNLDYSLLAGSEYVQRRARAACSPTAATSGSSVSVSISYTNSSYKDRRSFDSSADAVHRDDICVNVVSGDSVTQSCDRTNSSLRPVYVFDSRDSRFEPTRGMRFSASWSTPAASLGGDNYFCRPEVGVQHLQAGHRSSPVRTVFGVQRRGRHDPVLRRQAAALLSTAIFLGGEQQPARLPLRARSSLRDENGSPSCDEFGSPQGGDSFVQIEPGVPSPARRAVPSGAVRRRAATCSANAPEACGTCRNLRCTARRGAADLRAGVRCAAALHLRQEPGSAAG